MPPAVSVVVPARNAAETLPETLRSLFDQSRPDWEAIVVDDGSSDATRAIADGFAAGDARVRVLDGPSAGVSAARNAGIAAARGEWLLFLDADDWVLPPFFERLLACADRTPGAAAIYCGWSRIDPAGRAVSRELWEPQDDFFPILARLCPFAIHSVIARRRAVDAAGRFDESFVACEEWDLWQRMARRGDRFACVPEYLASYRMRAGSAATEARQMLVDGLRVIDAGHRSDPRLSGSPLTWPEGLARQSAPRVRLGFCCWPAGLAIGRGEDAVALLDAVAHDRSPELDPDIVAGALFRSVPLVTCEGPDAWDTLAERHRDRIGRFLDALERQAETPRLAARAWAVLERLQLEHSARLPRVSGRHYAVAVDASRAIEDAPLPAGIDRVLVVVAYEDERLGSVELPAAGGVLRQIVVADAVAARFSWPLLLHALRPIYDSLQMRRTDGAIAVYRGEVCLAPALAEQDTTPDRLHDAIGWTLLLQELFDRPDLVSGQFYEEAHRDGNAPVVRVSTDGWVRIEAAAEIPALHAGGDTVTVLVTVGGAAIAAVPVTLRRGRISAHALRARLIAASGLELARAVVREALLLTDGDPGERLPDRLRRRAAAASVSRTPGPDTADPQIERAPEWAEAIARWRDGAHHVIARRAASPVGSSASRYAMLPAAAWPPLRDAALAAGEPIVEAAGDPSAVAYVPELFWRRHGRASPPAAPAQGRREADQPFGRHHFESIFARPDPWKYTSAYEQTKYAHTLALLPDGPIGRALEIGCAEGHFTAQLAPRVAQLVAADISAVALERARARCAACPNVSFVRLDVLRDPLPPDQDLVVCSELLYYVGDRRALHRIGEALRDALAPGGMLVTAHANVAADDPSAPGFDWDVPFGAKTIAATLAGIPGLTLVSELRTPLYRVCAFRRDAARRRFGIFGAAPAPRLVHAEHAPLPPEVAPHVRTRAASTRPPRTRTVTSRLPILMYHRISDAGADATAPYRVSPADFEEQLGYLRDAGFRTVDLDDWRQAVDRRQPLDGRAVVLTFDDGYEDFAEVAWPLLRKYGFGAIVFLVSDRVGAVNDWDRGVAERPPLMDWGAIETLAAEGVRFGAHSATHPPFSALTPAEMAREASRSRAALLAHVRTAVPAFAYPYGDVDGVAAHVVGACGFLFGVTCEPRACRPEDSPLGLPRLEVRGGASLSDFIAMLTDRPVWAPGR